MMHQPSNLSGAPRRTPRPLAAIGLAIGLALAGCAEPVPPRAVANGEPDRGAALMAAYGCGACHTIPGVDGADGRVAPPLAGFADRAYVGGVVSNRPGNLIAWIQDPRDIDPQTAMPNLGVTEQHARHMAAYLYTLR